MSVKDRLTFTESTVTRAFTFSIDPIVRNIIGQKKTTFTVKDTSVIIASFPQELGTEMGSFLATLLLSQLPDGMLTVLDDGRYALQGYTVEKRRRGWYFTRTFAKAEQPEWKGPYRSIASITLVIAKQLKR